MSRCNMIHMLLLAMYLIFEQCKSVSYMESSIQFSPDGRIAQLDLAQKAVEKGSSVVAISAGSEGVLILTVRKRENAALLMRRPVQNIFPIDVNMLLCCTGWISDASTVHNFATNAALSYRENFGDAISAYALGLATANAMHNRIKKGVRPIGAGFLLVGADKNSGEFEIHRLLPDGSCTGALHVGAIGQKSEEVVSHFAQIHKKFPLNLSESWDHVLEIIEKYFPNEIEGDIVTFKKIADRSNLNCWDVEVLEGRFFPSSMTQKSLQTVNIEVSWNVLDNNKIKAKLLAERKRQNEYRELKLQIT